MIRFVLFVHVLSSLALIEEIEGLPSSVSTVNILEFQSFDFWISCILQIRIQNSATSKFKIFHMYSCTILLDLLHRAVEKKGCVLKGLFYILALTLVKALVVPHQTSVWRGLRFFGPRFLSVYEVRKYMY